MKICTRCLQEHPLENFYEQKQKGDVNGQVWSYRDAMCKPCRGEYTSDRRRQTKIQCVEYKGGKCEDCGLVDDPCVYDFHHLDPTQKDFSPGKTSRKFESMKEELDKCILLCSNCHRKRHL